MHEDDVHVVDEQTASAPETPPDDPVEDAQPERTVEAVEAEYRARLSGKDRAHAAEKKALEDRIAALTASTQQQETVKMDELAQLRSDNERLAREAAEAKAKEQAAAIEARKARFPHAAESLGDDLVGTVPEDKLASLETRLRGGAGGDDQPILPNGGALDYFLP